MQLRPYQFESVDFLARTRIALLAHEMRVGKTPCAIVAAQKIGAKRVLVLCPAIAVPMWRCQFPLWWPGCPVPVVMSFEKALLRKAEILADEYDVVIVDEAHFAGNPEAQRTKMIYGKDGLAWRTRRLWALSGTPAPKHAGSLWPILRAAGVVGMSYDAFVRRYCRIDWASQRPVGTKEEYIPEIRGLWQQIGLRRTRKEVAPDMPEIGFNFLEMEPTKGVDLRPVADEDIERQADIDREDRVAVAMAKTGPLCEEIGFALANGLLEQGVVFGWHVEPLKKIVCSLTAMGYRVALLSGETSEAKRVEIQEQFRLGLLDIVVGQIRACGTAISLPAKHGWFVELDWLSVNNMQAASRLVVIGNNEPVTMDVCTWPGSTDDRVQRVLVRRARELSKLFA